MKPTNRIKAYYRRVPPPPGWSVPPITWMESEEDAIYYSFGHSAERKKHYGLAWFIIGCAVGIVLQAIAR